MTLRRQLAGGLSALLFLLSSYSHGESGRADYDLDDDGLIEINDLADLDEIRNNLDGSSLYASSDGCPADGCNGFELTTDLDFDNNGDGEITELDDYWNEGSGWLPIGDSSNKFSAIFDGSYYTINNLHFSEPVYSGSGLFGHIENASIRRLRVQGSVTGRQETGLIVGKAYDSTLSELIAYGEVTATSYYLGGIAGRIENSTLFASAAHIRLSGSSAGALVGNANSTNTIEAVYATGNITYGGAGGFINSGDRNTIIKNSYSAVHLDGSNAATIAPYYGRGTNIYWVTDYINTLRLGRYSSASGGGYSLNELACPTTANNTGCTDNELYNGWETSTYEDGSPVWDFGTEQQLPALIWNGAIIRDTDNDGILNEDDDFPENYAAYQDSDADGHPDFWTAGCNTECQSNSGLTIDHFPGNVAASLDSDADNQPEIWNSSCDQTCQQNSGLVIDTSPNDRNNKNGSDLVDNDDNDDGQIDADADSDGLIEISTLEQFSAIRYQFNGAGRRLSEDGELDSSGCPLAIIDGYPKAQCVGYELVNDLDFDTNGNGEFDSGDSFWNDGEGLEKIPALRGILEGNGFNIRNLTTHLNSSSDSVAIFGGLINAEIRNLAFINTSVTSNGRHGGGIAAFANKARLHKVLFSGAVETQSSYEAYVGGIIGRVNEGVRLNEVAFIGSVTSNPLASGATGGLISRAISDNQITNSFVSAAITGNFTSALLGINGGDETATNSLIENSYFSGAFNGNYYSHYGNGPLVGRSRGTTTFNNNHWLKGSHENDNGLTLNELTCPVADSDTDCADTALYQDWPDEIWDFGSNNQTPALTIAGAQYRDSDGDGVADVFDSWPNLYAAHKDADNDGYPDSWNPHCDSECIANSGLQLDNFPQHQEIWSDSDLDGLPELCDASCATALAGSGIIPDPYANDFDNDGTPDAEDDNTNGVLNADSNGNGLIDIRTLADLNAMRFQLEGAAKVVSETADPDNSGCPVVIHNGQNVRRCHGYELMNDLNFDTNGDHKIDENDDFWNDGQGWLPIAPETRRYFVATFNGNGHSIKNLYVNTNSYNTGLFSSIKDADIKNIVFDGPLTFVNGSSRVAVLVGSADESDITDIIVTTDVTVTGISQVAGLAAYAEDSVISKVFVAATVRASYRAAGISYSLNDAVISDSLSAGAIYGEATLGGIVGEFFYHANSPETIIRDSLSTAYVQPVAESGGIIGTKSVNGFRGYVIRSYWAADTSSQQELTSYAPEQTSWRLTSETLQCAVAPDTTADNSDCVTEEGVTLFESWDTDIWDFGNNAQLPGLKIAGRVVRDSDGDGALDADDIWSDNSAAYQDVDADGHPDFFSAYCNTQCQLNSQLPALDKFPQYPGAWRDDDFDGLVEDCDQACIDASDDNGLPLLVADTHLLDQDNDGIPDSEDTNRNNDRDINNHEIVDADADHDGLIEIATLEELNAIRFQLNGHGQRLSEDGEIDSTGCPFVYLNGQHKTQCHGYELVADLDFDSNGDGVVSELDDYWNNGKGWSPIAVGSSGLFRSELSGNGHRIDNLYINNDKYVWNEFYGLFGALEGARIHDLIITGRIVHTGQRAGLLAGEMASSTINNIVASGEVYSDNYMVGLLAGNSENSSISNVMAFGRTKSDTSDTGAIVARAEESTISNSYSLVLTRDGKNPVVPVGSLRVRSAANSIYWQDMSASVDIPPYYGTPRINTDSFSLQQLQCPTQAETSVNSSACHDNEDVILFSGWDASQWDFGTNQQLPALKVGDTFYRDSDGDGIVDANDDKPYDFDNDSVNDLNDGYPFTSIGLLADADQDGIPDDCDPSCIALGMTADEDDDNDLIPDESDGYPTVAIGNYADNDNDGRPDDCDTSCQATGMAADPDDDNDDIDDINDDFDFIAAASVDADNDGFPDAWNESCDTSCQQASELVLDTQLDDTDNDGVKNDDDPDNNADNGKPVLATIAEDLYAPVNNSDGTLFNLSHATLTEMFDALSASDIVDAADELTFKAFLDGTEINRHASNITLPSGLHIVSWYAYDIAGNQSEVKQQKLFIYPQVRFATSESKVGEPDTATIRLELTGFAPEYPVEIPVQVALADSSASQTDINETFNITEQKLVRIERGEGEVANTSALISVPVLQEFIDEDDEELVLTIVAKPASSTTDELSYVLPEDGRRHTLTILDMKDTDRDGMPDECNTDCLNVGKTEDIDDDGDAYADVVDEFPLNPAAAFDADSDGLPDEWAIGCDANCRATSGLIIDTQLNDTDNDGVKNDVDTDNNTDNGKPTLISVAPVWYSPVNNEDGTAHIMTAASLNLIIGQLVAEDIVDAASAITYQGILNGTALDLRGYSPVEVPVGLQTISWYALDSAGNRSEPMEQKLYIYPEVRFSLEQSQSAENITAEIEVELSGVSPEYPVEIPVKLNLNNSTASALDLSPEFEAAAIHTVVIELGDGETANTTGVLQIPILEDNISEQDETLQLEISAKPASQGGEQLGYALPEDGKNHTLTITEMNLPPAVTLELRQGGEQVNEIQQDGGLVTITAVVTDPNVYDQHTLAWDLNDLGLAAQAGETVTVNPAGLPAQEYEVVVTVTDNATPPLSAQAEVTFQLKAAAVEPTPGGDNGDGNNSGSGSSSGGGGGGAMHLWYLLLLFIGVYGLRRRHK